MHYRHEFHVGVQSPCNNKVKPLLCFFSRIWTLSYSQDIRDFAVRKGSAIAIPPKHTVSTSKQHFYISFFVPNKHVQANIYASNVYGVKLVIAHNILKFIFCIYLFIFKSVELASPVLKYRRLETHNTSDAIETIRYWNFKMFKRCVLYV